MVTGRHILHRQGRGISRTVQPLRQWRLDVMIELVVAGHYQRLLFRNLHQFGIGHDGANPVVLPVKRNHRGCSLRVELRAAIGHAEIHAWLLDRRLRRATADCQQADDRDRRAHNQ